MATSGIPLINVRDGSSIRKNCSIKLSLDGWKKKVVRIHENGPHKEVFNCSLDDLIIIGSSSHMIELTDKRIGNQVKKMVEFESSFDKKLFEQQCESICEVVSSARVQGIAYKQCLIEIEVTSTGKTVVCSDIGDDGSKTLLFGCRAHPDSFLDEDTASTTALVFKTQDDFNLVEFMSMGHKELFMQQCFPEQFEVHSSGLVSVRGALPMQSGFSFSGVRSDGSRRFECRKLVQNSGRDIYGLKTEYYSHYAFPPVNIEVAIAVKCSENPVFVSIKESDNGPTIALLEFRSEDMADDFLFAWDEGTVTSNGD